jgi:coiled-coil and C2 domain-containing protein 2A
MRSFQTSFMRSWRGRQKSQLVMPFKVRQLTSAILGETKITNFFKNVTSLHLSQHKHAEARGSAGYVTKPDNKISRLLKELLTQIPSALERVAMASLGASLVLAEAPADTPGEAPERLGERHKLISQMQVLIGIF